MAKRWVAGLLLGALAAGLAPSARAQTYPDPAPVFRASVPSSGGAFPAYGSGPNLVVPASCATCAPGGPMPMMPPPPPAACGNDCAPHCKDNVCWEDDDRCRLIVSFGWYALARQHLKRKVLAVFDPVPFDDDIRPTGGPIAAEFSDVDPELHHGFNVGFAWYNEDHAWELAGFFIPNNGDGFVAASTGQLSSFFFNPPLGFEGTDASLWDNADIIATHLRTTFGGAEFNSRWYGGSDCCEFEFLIGARYVDLTEKLTIFTDDDSVQFGFNPLTQATYTTQTRNHLFGGQSGFVLRQALCCWLAASWEVRGAWFGNFSEVDVSLVRGDGLVGFDTNRDHWRFAHLYETGLFLNAHGRCWKAKAGYNFLWMGGVATAEDQVDFDLSHTQGRRDYNGSIFFHGPSASLEIVF